MNRRRIEEDLCMGGFNKKTAWWALTAVAAVIPVVYGYQTYQRQQAEARVREARMAEIRADKAEFERLCKEVAGYKFYRRAENVEGILLPKIRHYGEWRDAMAPGAAFALEEYDGAYIDTFLGYRFPSSVMDNSYPTSTSKSEGAIPGFKYVDIIDEQDGKRYRVTGSHKAVRKQDTSAPEVKRLMAADPNYDLNVYNWVLDKVPAPEPAPRFAVTFEDHVVPAERARGLASSTVRVIDTQTGEVMAEMLRYAWTPGRASPANPRPWLTAYKCPGFLHGSDNATRQFVDRVLVPPGASAPPPLP
ncbi:hypothetical protein [Niveibacterium sp. SC-1]|uniref:hypothetical protein n=1 Tax=Niveibacterium sp. SC-1 TaxID=3135646 RepID=UPI00311FEA94